MRAGIITFYWSKNLGALIQALSLKNFIEIEFSNIKVDFEKYLPKDLVLRENKSQLNTKNPIKWIKAKKKKSYIEKWKINVAKMPLPSFEKNEFNKDLYIYGSDEIWNYDNPFFKFDEYFFGDKNLNIKIAYAVSIGNLKFNINNLSEKIKNNILSFKNITVRDKNTFDFVTSITKKTPYIACDPSLLISPEIISGKNSKYESYHFKKEFILIYGTYFSSKEIIEIKKYAKLNNLIILSLSYYNIWADKNLLDIDPNDFIFFIQKSKKVITSMFHGIILSYKNKKNFWFSKDPYRENKINFFLNKFDLNDRNLNLLNEKDINYEANENQFNDWIEESKNNLVKDFKK